MDIKYMTEWACVLFRFYLYIGFLYIPPTHPNGYFYPYENKVYSSNMFDEKVLRCQIRIGGNIMRKGGY